MFSNDLQNLFKKQIVVSVSDDRMEAYVTLSSPPPGEIYSLQEILAALRAHKVVYGLKQDVLLSMVENRLHNLRTCVAAGVPCKDGTDGWFEFFFNTNPDRMPKTLPDGSVDYRSLDLYEAVNKGDKIAEYHPAVKGTPGQNVHGAPILPTPCRDMVALTGSGFSLSEDRRIYTANYSGKVELVKGSLHVTSVLLVPGDTDNSTGDIRFSGDVVIKGNVNYGYSIIAEGSVTVCGSVEAAKIVAGRNVELRNGMQGGGKGSIECYGRVSGKFFEQVTITCGEDLRANSILHCNIKTQGKVIVSGRHGIIVGGVTEAAGGIIATVLGNIAETKTKVSVGAPPDYVDFTDLEQEINKLTEDTERLTDAINKLDELYSRTFNRSIIPKKAELTQARDAVAAQLKEKKKEMEELLAAQKLSQMVSVRVSKYLYPGVTIVINGNVCKVDDTYNHVNVRLVDNEIKILAIR